MNKSAGQDCEDSDRTSLGLPYGQDAVIEALAAANPRTIVVNVSGNAVAMPWVKKVPAIVQAWFLGSEAVNLLGVVPAVAHEYALAVFEVHYVGTFATCAGICAEGVRAVIGGDQHGQRCGRGSGTALYLRPRMQRGTPRKGA